MDNSNDMIRRGDALKTADEELRRYGFSAPQGRRYDMRDAIASLPAVTPAPDAAAIREAALREAAAVAEAALNVPCVKCGVTRAQHHHRHPFVPSGVTDPVVAILALIQKGGA